ncbi:ParB/RepB/Spo0J family partition protein [Methylobacterium sp. SI9]|uniref:ParB/RepB/Spo0J family partition protein n=1 Tax=Methylobacterium guangdongense TaxID=3138811 RepID=UPI00313EE959
MTAIPLSMLRPGHHPEAPPGVANVRQIGRDAGLDALAASIGALGLLQPLVVVAGPGGYRYVVDGNRRLAAIQALVEKGTLPPDTETDVVERQAADAREAGLAANITQEAMHEADKVQAFAQLAASGAKPKEIAGHFGVSVPHVKKLLALGGVAPVILDAWRTGKNGVGIHEVQAFTLAPSIEVQERVFEKLAKGGSIYTYAIREELGAGNSTAALLKRVGLDAYKAAGGKVIADLFGDTTAVSDRELLQRLSDERLLARRDELRADGWGWAEIYSDLPPESRYSWPTLREVRREPTEAEAARMREIEALLDAEDDGAMSDAEIDAAQEEHRTIEKALVVELGPEDKARSGCILD